MITMIIAEDQHMLRKAMVQLIELNDDLKVLADVGNGNDALELIKTYEPDIAILDIEMPGMTGIEVLAESKALKLQTKIIIVTTFKRPGYFEKAVANDVDAYVLKERSIDELVNTIQKVVNGKKEYSDSLMTSLITYTNPLTHKEQVVLREIGNGLSSKDIADKLYLSNGTIRNYTSSIIDKLEAENRFDAWKIATNNGWI
ncbi:MULTISPECIES: response regulator transcription factor [Staphylococcus]|uniref:response regulator transcription factor n=1 Tax=Staphylococcus TaxID=1279 RepID=UPI00041B6CA3|nr:MULTISPECIES: response regulator transcription factor [Staphylococcus]QAV31658.1 DNA-binding response regulator [Sulfitobacter donghicola]KAB7647338.1 response regulator transcription factor [Staphylococcus sp. B2-b]MBN6851872.1 response regulator transcription factor [Staphylococcus warneri]MBT2769339.1 response regulator transcription factor [Staphylococcus warneri]MCF7595731.1 response regulator transcription factor [Staphylococcus warneri]